MKRGIYSDFKSINLGDKELIFLSGKIARDENGPIAPGDIEKQTEFIFQDIQKTLKKAGGSLDDVIKAVIYLVDIRDFKKVSKIRDVYFEKSKPVSTLVEISGTSREGCDIEVEVTAVKNN